MKCPRLLKTRSQKKRQNKKREGIKKTTNVVEGEARVKAERTTMAKTTNKGDHTRNPILNPSMKMNRDRGKTKKILTPTIPNLRQDNSNGKKSAN